MDSEAPGRLVVVSNRLPLQAVVTEGGKIKLQPGGGGLVAAMRFVLEEAGGLWIGWPGEGDTASFAERTSDLPFNVVPVHLTKEEVNGHYDGFTNRTLWPLFHDLVGRTTFDRAWWDHYVTVNRKFGEVAAAHSQPGDLVWAQDFHLLLFAKFFRELQTKKGRDTRLGFFLHTPFPPFMLFQRIPWRAELIQALLEFDTIGFQTERDLGAFVRCALALCPEAKSVDFTERLAMWEHDGRLVQAGVYPISIDFEFWDRMGREESILKKARRFRERNGNRKIIIGVDRLDYSKGIPQRLRAFAELLERHPDEREKVQFLQIAVPSRTSIYEYKEIKRQIDALIGQINGKFGTPSWVPVNYLYRSFGLRDLAAYYRASDVALVTPIKDGMNLVAKEFIAASVAGKGVLVLSEFAGAAYELEDGAIIVNPHDVVETANALHKALHMPPEEQEARLDLLRTRVSTYDVHRWSRDFIAAARGVEAKIRRPDEVLQSWRGWRAPRILIHLDYDDVLAPVRPLPEMAAPDPETLHVLTELASAPDTVVVISSGGALKPLSAWFANPAFVLISGHGAAWRYRGEERTLLADAADERVVDEALEILSPIIEHAPGAVLEDKTYSLAVHYRMVAEFVLPRLLPKLRKTLREFVDEHEGLRLFEGRCVVELLPKGISGVSAFEKIRALLGFEDQPVVAISGDLNKQIFHALRPDDLSIHVGVGGSTHARYALRNASEVRTLLTELAATRAVCNEQGG